MLKITFAAALIATLATPAIAQDRAWRVGNDQVHLVSPNLDTRTADGRAALLARVEKAAIKLCDGLIGTVRGECVEDTVRKTAAGLKSRALALALTERDNVALAAR